VEGHIADELDYQGKSIGIWVFRHILKHIIILHPPRYHAEFEQFGRHAFNSQDVLVLHSLTNYNFLAVFLSKGSPILTLNRVLGEETSHLLNFFDRIPLVHAKRFYSEYQIMVFRMGEPPDIAKRSRREWYFLSRLAERESNFVTSGKDRI